MANIYPFRALYYSPHKVNIADVITPPYDVIGKDEEKKFFQRHPYNYAHINLPKGEDDDYSEKKKMLERWIQQGILHQTPTPGFYLYQQNFTLAGRKHTRTTFMGAVALSDFSEGIVRPHEQIHEGPKEDRLRILRQTQCNLGPIFAAVKDKEGILSNACETWVYHPSLLSGTTDDGITHSLWKIDPNEARDVVEFFRSQPLYIVDGHHRYNSALHYAKELDVCGNPDHPASQVLFAIANSYDPALIVLPTHRCVKGIDINKVTDERLTHAFKMKPISEDLMEDFTTKPSPDPSFLLHLKGKLWICTPKHWGDIAKQHQSNRHNLSVVWSDEILLKEICGLDETTRHKAITYVKSAQALWEQRKEADLAIFLPPIEVQDMTNVADEGGFLPQKTTFFFPKLASGLVIRSF